MKNKDKLIKIIVGVFVVCLVSLGVVLLGNKKSKEIARNSITNPVEKMVYDLESGKITKDEYIKEFSYLIYDNTKLDNDYKLEVKDPYVIETYYNYLYDYYDDLSEETKKYVSDKISMKDTIIKTKSISKSNTNGIVRMADDSSKMYISKAKISSNNRFIIWYSNEGASAITDEKAEEILNMMEQSLDGILQKYNEKFEYNPKFSSSNESDYKALLKENGIDEKYFKTAFPIYVNNLSVTAVSAYYVRVSLREKLFGLDSTDELIYSAPYMVFNSRYLSTDYNYYLSNTLNDKTIDPIEEYIVNYMNMKLTAIHELFHHFENENYNASNLAMGGINHLFQLEMLSEYTAALVFDKEETLNKAIEKLKKYGLTDEELYKYKESSYFYKTATTDNNDTYAETGYSRSVNKPTMIFLGYPSLTFAKVYSDIVNGGRKKLVDNIAAKDYLGRLAFVSGGKYDYVLRKLAEKTLTQDYDKDTYKSPVVLEKTKAKASGNEIKIKEYENVLKQRRVLCKDDCEYGDEIGYSAIYYYYINPKEYDNKKIYVKPVSNSDISVVVIGRIGEKFTTEISEGISSNGIEIYVEPYEKYDELVISVVNTSSKNDRNYVIGVKGFDEEIKENYKVVALKDTIDIEPEDEDYKYISSNQEILEKQKRILTGCDGEVAQNRFKAIKVGEAKVTIDMGNGKTQIVKVKVVDKNDYVDISDAPSAIEVGSIGRIDVKTKLTWDNVFRKKYSGVTSSDSSVLEVSADKSALTDSSFKYKAKKAGVVVVTVRNGSYSSSKRITVYDKISLKDYVDSSMTVGDTKEVCINSSVYKLKSEKPSNLEVIKIRKEEDNNYVTEDGYTYEKQSTCSLDSMYLLRAVSNGTVKLKIMYANKQIDDKNITILKSNQKYQLGRLLNEKESYNSPYVIISDKPTKIKFEIEGISEKNEKNYKIDCISSSTLKYVPSSKTSYDSNGNGIYFENGKAYGYCNFVGNKIATGIIGIHINDSRGNVVFTNYESFKEEGTDDIEFFDNLLARILLITSLDKIYQNTEINRNVLVNVVKNVYFVEKKKFEAGNMYSSNDINIENSYGEIIRVEEFNLSSEDNYEYNKYLPNIKVTKDKKQFYVINDNFKTCFDDEGVIYCINEDKEENEFKSSLWVDNKLYRKTLDENLISRLSLDGNNGYSLSNAFSYVEDIQNLYNEKNGFVKTNNIIFEGNEYYNNLKTMSVNKDIGIKNNGNNYYVNTNSYDPIVMPYMVVDSALSFYKNITGNDLIYKYKNEINTLNNQMNGWLKVDATNEEDMFKYMYAYYYANKYNKNVSKYINAEKCNYDDITNLIRTIENDYINEVVDN